jgi:hypothetical protein
MATDKKSSKQRAGVILSSLLRTIAEEETEVGGTVDDPIMITKAEALVRLVFKHALGFKEDRVGDKGERFEVEHKPDKTYIAMVWDRLEGRVAAVEPGKKEKRTVADKVGAQNKDRLNKLAKGSIE